jgi:predicted ATPase
LEAIDAYDFEKHGHLAFVAGHDPKATSMNWLPIVLWNLGYPDQARHAWDQALVFSRRINHPLTLAHTFQMGALLSASIDDRNFLRRAVSCMTAIGNEHGFIYVSVVAELFDGWLRAVSGNLAEGISGLQHGLKRLAATGCATSGSYYQSLLSKAYAMAGRVEDGLATLDMALEQVQANGDRYIEAMLHRLKGELLQMQEAAASEIENHFQRALGVARRQKAKSFELRAATSLARLWQEQGKKEEAHKILSDVYGWFTEGFDTPDLKDAKALLEELS